MQVLDAIAAARPKRLYVAADGPRANRPNEAELTAKVRDAVLARIDWPCQVETLFQERNLGCRRGVITAIDWFFDREAEGVILEDDVVPSPDFFPYCGEMLERYRDDPRIMMVSGTNQLGAGVASSHYFYSSLGSIWGWASWRRAWSLYDEGMSRWGPDMSAMLMRRHGQQTARYLAHVFNFHVRNHVDTWDTQWLYTIQHAEGLAVMPEANLIRNVGIIGAHSNIETSNHNLAHGALTWPLAPKNSEKADNAEYRSRMVREVFTPTMTISRASHLARTFGLHGIARAVYRWVWHQKQHRGS